MPRIALSNYGCPKCGSTLCYEGRQIAGGTNGDRTVTDVYRCSNCGTLKKLGRSEADLRAEYVRLEVDRLVRESPFPVDDKTRQRLEDETTAYFVQKDKIQQAFTRDQSFLTQDFYLRTREIIQEGLPEHEQ